MHLTPQSKTLLLRQHPLRKYPPKLWRLLLRQHPLRKCPPKAAQTQTTDF